jgi:tripartite-type tricarboxylate transporter receptor subunit TctC
MDGRLRATVAQRQTREETAIMPSRRDILRAAAAAGALATTPRIARAEIYPSRPVHLIVPYAPGGTTDAIARLIGQFLSERLGQPFLVESRAGAGTNVGTETVVRSTPDGYTLLVFDPSSAINATLYDKLNFNFMRDMASIVAMFRTPLVIVVKPSLQAKTLPELIAYAKSNPGKINLASAGIGSSSHLAGELFDEMAGIEMTHIPYRGGGPAIAALLGGEVDVFFSPMAIAIAHIQAGKFRALAVTSATRSPALPHIPTAGEFVPGYEASYWVSLGAPKATPEDILDKLNKETNAGLADKALLARFADLGGIAIGGSRADCGKLVADETEKWAKVIHSANIETQ